MTGPLQIEWLGEIAEQILDGTILGVRDAEVVRKAASELQSQSDRIAELEGDLIEEREENLWNAYNCGVVKDGRWTHMFMSDGEWLARQCGFDSKLYDYDDAAIRAAIPNAARASLTKEGQASAI